MANETKLSFLRNLRDRYGTLRKLEKSQSLYEIGDGAARIYIRYSKIHGKGVTFYGLRKEDLQRLEGHSSIICFLWNNQDEPLFLPFEEYEEVFQNSTPASDGQYKVQIYLQEDGTDLYVTKAGRFNVESYFGWEQLETFIDSSKMVKMPELTHPQVQTLLGSIGTRKGFDIWIPTNDRPSLDWTLTGHFECRSEVPYGFSEIEYIIKEIDVIWINKGSSTIRSLYEVEHTTPIYSGLLRFNDIHLVQPKFNCKFNIVSYAQKKSKFLKEINRPTFLVNNLNKLCSFIDYPTLYRWFTRMQD